VLRRRLVSPEPDRAPAPPLAQPVANPDYGLEIEPEAEVARIPDDETDWVDIADPIAPEPAEAVTAAPGQPTRELVLASFMRSRPQPQPAAPQPAHQPQPRPPERPRQVEPEQERLSEAAIDELLAGYAVGNLAWPRRQLGPKPGEPGCRIPHAVLRRNRLA
jgi:hypothetical protein